MPSVAPIAAVIPVVPAVASTQPASDPYTYLMQLGVGGVLVAFAIWLQDKFSKQSRKDVDAERERTAEMVDQLISDKDKQIAEKEARLAEAAETITRLSKEKP